MAELILNELGFYQITPSPSYEEIDRFYREDRSRNRSTGGSGLGLAITKQLVEAHGGTIEANSRLGVGSSFEVKLPLGNS